VRLFILPPDADSLRTRLIGRNQDAAAVIAKRMAEAGREISHWPEYDYVVVNEVVDEAHAEVMAILTAERLKRRRQLGLTDFVRGLVKDL
jgi:guanylate kinase